MAGEKDRVAAYLNTIDRLEPEITEIDQGAYYASAAISLKRIADGLDRLNETLSTIQQWGLPTQEKR